MPEQPAGEQEEQHREARTPRGRSSPPDRVGADVLGDLVADEEPLVDGAGDREQHEEERQAVAALILLERLGPERPEQPAGAVRQAHPRADDDGRLLRVADVPLGRRRRLARRATTTRSRARDHSWSGLSSWPFPHGTAAEPPNSPERRGSASRRPGCRRSAQALDHRVAADAALRDGEPLAAVQRRGEVAALDAQADARVAVAPAPARRAPAAARGPTPCARQIGRTPMMSSGTPVPT